MREWLNERAPGLIGVGLCLASVGGWVALGAWAIVHDRTARQDWLIIERHETLDRRPGEQHERAIYRALIDHYAMPVNELPDGGGPEPALVVPMGQVEGAISSAVDAEGR